VAVTVATGASTTSAGAQTTIAAQHRASPVVTIEAALMNVLQPDQVMPPRWWAFSSSGHVGSWIIPGRNSVAVAWSRLSESNRRPIHYE
jgi:hypothetical protein